MGAHSTPSGDHGPEYTSEAHTTSINYKSYQNSNDLQFYYFSQTTLVDDDKIIHEISFSKFACPPRHNLVCIGVDHWPSSGAQVMIDVNLGCQVSERDQGYRGISYLNAS